MVVIRTKNLKKRRPKPLRKKASREIDWEGVRRAIEELEHTVSDIYIQGKAVADSVALLRQQLPMVVRDTEDDIPF